MEASSIVEEKNNFIPAGDAAKYFGYTKEYLLMLAKDGKILGNKSGNKWFVDLGSAEAFFKRAEDERAVRRKKISDERKQEFQKYTQTTQTHGGSEQHKLREATPSNALVEVGVVMLIGLTIGLTGYLGTNGAQVANVASGEQGFFKQLARSLYEILGGESADVEVVETVEEKKPIVVEGTGDDRMSTAEGQHDNTALIIAPAVGFTATTAREIAESFSDEVVIQTDPEHPETGIVIPKFKTREGEAYRFLMVPIEVEGEKVGVSDGTGS